MILDNYEVSLGIRYSQSDQICRMRCSSFVYVRTCRLCLCVCFTKCALPTNLRVCLDVHGGGFQATWRHKGRTGERVLYVLVCVECVCVVLRMSCVLLQVCVVLCACVSVCV